MFGTFRSNLSEDIHPDCSSLSDPVGWGTYSIKMKLHTLIPQLIPSVVFAG